MKIQVDFHDVAFASPTANVFTFMKSVSTCFVAFSFANNLFPIYSSLKVKTPENMKKVASFSIGIVLSIYSFLSVVALFLFGRNVNSDTNILN